MHSNTGESGQFHSLEGRYERYGQVTSEGK